MFASREQAVPLMEKAAMGMEELIDFLADPLADPQALVCQKTRQLEFPALSQALAILNRDDALVQTDSEIKHTDFCTEEFDLYLRQKFILIASIEDLEISIKTLTDEIQGLKAEIAGMQVQLKHAGEDCVKEHKVL